MKTYWDVAGEGSPVAEEVGAQAERLERRMAGIRRVVAVASGKGGVGKSTIAANLAVALASMGKHVGLLDADLNGASVATLLGGDLRPQITDAGVRPVRGPLGVRYMTIEMFLDSPTDPVVWQSTEAGGSHAWRGLMEMSALREMVADTDWGELDVLIVDVPPGADRMTSIVDLVPRIDLALLVTIPSALSRHVVGKSVVVARERLAPAKLAVVVNMDGFVCPECRERTGFFAGSGAETEWDLPVLGRVPLDPSLGASVDGETYLLSMADRPAARELRRVAGSVLELIEQDSQIKERAR